MPSDQRLRRTARGTIAKAMIAVAVLVPALLVVVVALRAKMLLTGVRIGSLTPWMIADGALLLLGLLLHRGEEI